MFNVEKAQSLRNCANLVLVLVICEFGVILIELIFRIANVVRKQAPFLKMYSEYTNNYDRATKVFEEMKKKKKFADVVREIEVLMLGIFCIVRLRFVLILFNKCSETSGMRRSATQSPLDMPGSESDAIPVAATGTSFDFV